MLSARNIQKKYGQIEVLKGVDIEIGKGEVVSIVGPSGSGKSTLLHILGTLDKADFGYVEINQVRIENQEDARIKPAAWYLRALNFFLDGIPIAGLLVAVVGKDAILDNYSDPSLKSFLFAALITFLYYFILEWIAGKTLAKYITGTKVFHSESGAKPKMLELLFRTLGRFIPFDYFSFFASYPRGWHDTAGSTMVASSRVAYKKRPDQLLSKKQLALFRNKHIGFVFQFHHLLPEFTALENVCIPGWLAGRDKAEVKQKAMELLKILGLSHRMENKPNEMSGGEQQRVAVARALINNPSIVMADEPTGNLDSANAKELHQLFIDLRRQFNQTFLIVTHNEELAQMSDRIVHMKDGRIING
jgi:ABC-type lipoprotein export system ATPase subunit